MQYNITICILRLNLFWNWEMCVCALPIAANLPFCQTISLSKKVKHLEIKFYDRIQVDDKIAWGARWRVFIYSFMFCLLIALTSLCIYALGTAANPGRRQNCMWARWRVSIYSFKLCLLLVLPSQCISALVTAANVCKFTSD